MMRTKLERPDIHILEPFTTEDIMTAITEEVVLDFSVTEQQAEKLILNAMSYNTVVNAIKAQISEIINVASC